MKVDSKNSIGKKARVSLAGHLEKYLKKREAAVFYQGLIDAGRLEMKKLDKMINAKVFKPSELKKEAEIGRAIELHDDLLKLLQKEEIILILNENEIDIAKIKGLRITKVSECKIVYETYRDIGTLGKRKLGFFLFVFMPFRAILVTIIEFLLLCFFVIAWVILKRYIRGEL